MSNNIQSTAVLYCRYSSHNQRDVSIDQQIKACEAFAERENIRIVKVYSDRAMTGTNDRRPEFQKMISEAPALDVQYVIVYSLDRFARDRYDSAVYKRQLKSHKIRVLSATENISDDPTGVLLESMLEGLAEYYSAELARKIKRGLSDNASKGLVTGPPSYGYRAKDGHYEIIPEQAEVIREIYRRTLAGESRLSIVNDLNDRHIPTRLGGTWKRTSLETILKNERYIGTYLYGDVRIEGAMPQIVDTESFNAVQRIFMSKVLTNKPIRRRTDGGVYLLTGRVFCGHCGSPMVGLSGKSRAGVLHYYYVCKGHRYKKICDKSAIRRDQLEKDIAAAIQRHILSDARIEKIADLAMQSIKDAEKQNPVAALEREKKSTTTAINNIMSAIEQGIITATTKQRLQELEEKLQNLETQISAERYAHRPPDITREDIVLTLKLFQDGDINDQSYREKLIDSFVESVYVYDDHFRIRFHLGSGNHEDVDISTSLTDPSAPSDPSSPEPSDVRITNDTLHHTGLIRTEVTIIAVGVCSFLLICPRA